MEDGGKEPTVLIVDDEPNLVDLFAAFLEDAFDVRTATSGEKAIELVDDSVDVVLLDRRMPKTSGGEVLSTIRDRGYDMPVEMVTAVSPDVDVVDMPFDEYLTKPIERDELRETVELLVVRGDFDEKSREFFRLASKKAALEAEGDVPEDTEEYQQLVERMETLRAELDTTLETLLAERPAAAFRSL